MPTAERARKMFMDSLYMEVIRKLSDKLWADFCDEYMKLMSTFRNKHLTELAALCPDESARPPSSTDRTDDDEPGPSSA